MNSTTPKRTWIAPDVNGIFHKIDESKFTVLVHENRRSDKVKTLIPLNKFSEDFKKMVDEGFIEKVFYDAGVVTAVSIKNTFFVPKIGHHGK